MGPLGAGFGGDSRPGEAGKTGGEETAVPAVPCGPGTRREGRKASGIKTFFPDFSPGQAERLAVLPGTGFGGLAPLPPIVTNKVQKEKGDDTWQNQENEIKL